MISKLLSLLQRKPAPAQRRAPSRAQSPTPAGRLARRPEIERDRRLAPETQRWIASLPPPARPVHLAARYPRICNHLALVWGEDQLVEHYFSSLLVDDRGGRTGFQPEVGAELIRLHVFHINRAISPHAVKAWDDRMLAVGDR